MLRALASTATHHIINTCIVAARAGTSDADVKKLQELYNSITTDPDFVKWAQDTMLIEMRPMDAAAFKAHLESVRELVNTYKDKVLG